MFNYVFKPKLFLNICYTMTNFNPNPNESNSGVIPLENAPLYPGASSPRESALMYREHQINEQNNLNKMGGKRTQKRKTKSRKTHKGGAITVPSFTTVGPQVSAGNQNPNGASQFANTNLLQSNENGVCDKCFDPTSSPICDTPQCNAQVGGGCGNSGLISDGQTWGCMSGGASRRINKSKKSMKSKKSKK